MTDSELFRIAQKLIDEDNDNLICANYADKDLESCDRDELILDIKIEMKERLGICGCGNPEIVLEGIYNILSKIKEKSDCIQTRSEAESREKYNKIWNDISKWAEDDWTHLYTLYAIDNAGFTTHGSSIYGAWITDTGKDFLTIFEDGIFECHY